MNINGDFQICVSAPLKENFISGRTWSYAKLFVLKKDTAIADMCVLLAVKYV